MRGAGDQSTAWEVASPADKTRIAIDPVLSLSSLVMVRDAVRACCAPEVFAEGAGENLVMSAGDFENFMAARPELPGKMEQELALQRGDGGVVRLKLSEMAVEGTVVEL